MVNRFASNDVVLQLLVHGRSDTIPALFESLKKQTDKDWKILMLFNGCGDELRAQIEPMVERAQESLQIETFFSETNMGFAAGHQWLFKRDNAPFTLLVNDDVELAPDYIKILKTYLLQNPSVGAVSGKLLRPDGTIDTLGLHRSYTEKISNIGEGLPDTKSDTQPKEVFGVSGTLPMYRRSTVIQASHDGKLFDPEYQTYKEDVDLAYRFMHIGAKSIVIPAATAVHHRTFRKSLLHKGISDYNAYHSYKNHWWNLLTHISVWTFIKRSWAIIPFEIAKAVFIGSKHPKMLLHLIYDTFTHAKELRQKRGYFMSYESRR
jgi:GT2 family glycosyltransferase